MAKPKQQENAVNSEEYSLMLSLMSAHTSPQNVLDALTTDQGPGDIFSLLFFRRSEKKSIELTLTWAVSDEIQFLATRTSLFLCDADDNENMPSLMRYLRNIPTVSSELLGNLKNGVPETPSIIIIAPSQRRLVYAEYSCKLASLPTILMIVEDFVSSGQNMHTAHGMPPDASDEEEESIDGENYFDFESTPPPSFAVLGNNAEQRSRPNGPTAAQRDELEAMRRIQERQEIEGEYAQALVADRRAAAEEEAKRQAAEAEAERQRQEAERLRMIRSEKDTMRGQIQAKAPTSGGVRICLRTRSAEKVIFTLPAEGSLQAILEMAYATDSVAIDLSQVSICTTAPRKSYDMHINPMPTIGEVTDGCQSIAFIVEVSTPSS